MASLALKNVEFSEVFVRDPWVVMPFLSFPYILSSSLYANVEWSSIIVLIDWGKAFSISMKLTADTLIALPLEKSQKHPPFPSLLGKCIIGIEL